MSKYLFIGEMIFFAQRSAYLFCIMILWECFLQNKKFSLFLWQEMPYLTLAYGNVNICQSARQWTQWMQQGTPHVQISATRLIYVKLDMVCFDHTVSNVTLILLQAENSLLSMCV